MKRSNAGPAWPVQQVWFWLYHLLVALRLVENMYQAVCIQEQLQEYVKVSGNLQHICS